MAEIKDKFFATANGAMAVPTDNSGADNHTTLVSVADDYLRDVEGMVKTNGQGQFKIDVGGAGLVNVPLATETEALIITGGQVTPNVGKAWNFTLDLTEDVTIMLPSNINAGSIGRKITIFVKQQGVATPYNINFSASSFRYMALQGTLGLNLHNGGSSVIEIFINSMTLHSWRITPVYGDYLQPSNIYGGLIPFEKTITSAQLLAGTQVVVVPKQGANTYIEVVGRVFVVNGAGTTSYGISEEVLLKYDTSDTFATIELDGTPLQKHFAGINTTSIRLIIDNSDVVIYQLNVATLGDFDITVHGFFRIINLN